MPSFLCLLWGPALIKLPLLDLFLIFATDWRAGLSSAQPLNFSFLGKSWICASNVLKLAPKLPLFLVAPQLSRLISDFLYLCSVGLNWNSILCASFCKHECFVLYFTDQIYKQSSFLCSFCWSNSKFKYFIWAPNLKFYLITDWSKFFYYWSVNLFYGLFCSTSDHWLTVGNYSAHALIADLFS